jgi:hypothetical protein
MPSHKPTYGNFFEFKKDDVFTNRIKAYPKVDFFIYTGSVYYNNENQNYENPDVEPGFINLHDLNVNRSAHATGSDNQQIAPFVAKGGSFFSFKTISTDAFTLDHAFGDTVQGKYLLTASISVDSYGASSTSTGKSSVLGALKTTLDHHTILSPHYAYSSSFANKEDQPLKLISVPSIFYGSGIKKGSVFLKFYVTGALVGEASDIKRDGRLIQTTGSTTGDEVGIVLYNEGFLFLTSSTAITTEHSEKYRYGDGTLYNPSWHEFANTGSYDNAPSSSYSISMKGVSYIDTVTMFAHAKEGQLNFSNNQSFLKTSQDVLVENDIYHENSQISAKNIVSSSYKNHSASFKPVTYISKIGIYDENKNLIAIAGLANPVKKTEERAYTFKLKLDI